MARSVVCEAFLVSAQRRWGAPATPPLPTLSKSDVVLLHGLERVDLAGAVEAVVTNAALARLRLTAALRERPVDRRVGALEPVGGLLQRRLELAGLHAAVGAEDQRRDAHRVRRRHRGALQVAVRGTGTRIDNLAQAAADHGGWVGRQDPSVGRRGGALQ